MGHLRVNIIHNNTCSSNIKTRIWHPCSNNNIIKNKDLTHNKWIMVLVLAISSNNIQILIHIWEDIKINQWVDKWYHHISKIHIGNNSNNNNNYNINSNSCLWHLKLTTMIIALKIIVQECHLIDFYNIIIFNLLNQLECNPQLDSSKC